MEKLRPKLDESGATISPQLPDGVKNYLIDIDGTITEDVPNEEPERMAACEPYPDAVETMKRWYDGGHILTFFTSRTEEHRGVTEAWLKKHSIEYHALLAASTCGSCQTVTISVPPMLQNDTRRICLLCRLYQTLYQTRTPLLRNAARR